MANSKISALTSATTPLAGTETLPIVQSSTTKQVSVANLTVGRTQTSNGIVQGTAATGYNFTANTPASGMTSQLLNWYEEGTWTPTFIFATLGDLSVTYSVQVGRYTRIGRQVTVIADVETSAFTYTTASGTFRVSGLPFTSANTTGLNTVGSVAMSGWTKICNYIAPQILPNVSVISFLSSTNSGAMAVLTTTDVLSGNQQAVRLNITYFV